MTREHHYSAQSLEILNTCDPMLIDLFLRVGQYVNLRILCGHRDRAAQEAAYRGGYSRVQWPNSKHNRIPSLAVDWAPWYREPPHVRWDDIERWYFVAGIIIGIAFDRGIYARSGADWDSDSEVRDQRFFDLGHTELLTGAELPVERPRIV